MTDPKPIRPRGFAGMDPARRREIASMGGKAVKPEQRSFSLNREMARAAGRKGGKNVPKEKRSFFANPGQAAAAARLIGKENRSFSQNHELAREAGAKGGKASHGLLPDKLS